jgi:hypothetical protein
MSFEKNLKDFIFFLEPFSFHLGVLTTIISSWIMFAFLPIWQIYFIPGVIGGFLAGKRFYRGFFAGFLGTLIGEIIFLNFALFIAVESVELLMSAALETSDLGLIMHLIILVIWSLFSGFGGLIGVSLYSFFPIYELISEK